MVEFLYYIRNCFTYLLGSVINLFSFRSIHCANSVKFSIVIPVLNSEKTIKKTLDSIFKQKYKNLEIICVDNGSKDSSCNIIEEYQKINQHIKIAYSKTGVSFARNLGINISTGDYIIFLDSDDELIDDSLPKIAFYLKIKPDILVCSGVKTFGSLKSKTHFNSFWLKKKHNCQKLLFSHPSIRPHAANKIFKREFLVNNSIRFNNNLVIGEDQEFIYKCFLKTQYVYMINVKFYLYKQNHNSSMNFANRNIFKITNEHIKLADAIFNLYDKVNNYALFTCIDLIYNHSFKLLDESNKIILSRKIIKMLEKHKINRIKLYLMPISYFYYNKIAKYNK